MSFESVRSVLCGEAQPSFWHFICAPICCVIVGNVPRVPWGLDDGVKAGNTLNTHTCTQLIGIPFSFVPQYQLSPLKPFPPPPAPSLSHPKSDSLAQCEVSIHYQLVASLPFKEKLSGGSSWQAGLVVPHQVLTHKPTVVSRVQSGIQQEGIILWTGHKPKSVRWTNKLSQ